MRKEGKKKGKEGAGRGGGKIEGMRRQTKAEERI